MPKNVQGFLREEIENSLVERFEKIVSAYPENLAIKTEKGEINYQALNQKANQLASLILSQDEGPELAVAIFQSHTANPIISMLGILKAGKAFVPLNPNSPDERHMHVIQSSGAKTIITDNRFYDKLSGIDLGSQINIINIDKLPKDLPKENLGLRIKADDLCMIIYTSGSLGIPKGVTHVQQTIMHNVWTQTDFLKIQAEDRHILFSHLSYISGPVDILRTLLNGASLFPINFSEVGLKGLSSILQKEKITIYHSVPTIFRRLLEEEGGEKKYPSLRLIHLGGEPMYSGDVALVRKHFSPDCLMLNNLGSTEVPTFRRFLIEEGMKIEDGEVPVGYPVDDKEIRIVDEDGEELGVGETGEIVIESKFMSWGYFNDQDKTNENFRPVPGLNQIGRFFSGDIGTVDKEGRLKFLGRKDYQVKIYGNRIELGEVEAHLLSIADVHQAVVLAKENKGEKVLVAYIISSKGKKVSIEKIRQSLLEKLPVFMLPKEYILMDAFPYTQTDKVDRKAFPEPNFDNRVRQKEMVLPRTELEEKLVKIWQETLNIAEVGIKDNFFTLGGDSLTAVNLFLSIEQSFGVKLPISILLEAGDIEKQAAILIKTDYIANWSPIIEVQALGSKPPLFCLFGKGGNPLTFRQFSEYFGEDQPVYFLQARGLNGRETPLNVVENIASDFIHEIKKVFPKGPYRFCGASFGGSVGYEIARQLRDDNENVDLVVLFDSYGPGYPIYKTDKSKILLKIDELKYYLGKHWMVFRDANKQERKNYLRYYIDFIPEIIKMIKGKVNKKLDNWRAKRVLPKELLDVMESNVEALEKYYPGPYDGKVVLFKASHQPPGSIYDQKLGWGKVDVPDFEIHEVEAHHGSVLFEPRVKEVVEILKQYLN